MIFNIIESTFFRHQMSRVSEIDSFSSLNEVNLHHTPSWLELYMSACKLLDLLMYLPPDIIPDFQKYVLNKYI